MVRDGDGLPEDYPLHNFATRRGGQRTRVPVIAAQGCRQEVPEDERIQKGLLLCLGEEAKEKTTVSRSILADPQANPCMLVPHHKLVCSPPGRHSTGGGKATGNSSGS